MGNTTPGEEKKVYVLYYYIFNYKIAIFGGGCGGGWGTRKYSHPISVLYSWDLVRKRKSLIHSSLALQRIKQNSLIPRLRLEPWTVFRTKQIILFFFPPSDSDRDDTNSGSGSCKEDPDVCKYSLLKYMKSGIEWKRLWLYTRDVMVKMWTGFARSSDPTPANSGLPFTWTQHVSQTPLYLEITEHPGIPLSCSVWMLCNTII